MAFKMNPKSPLLMKAMGYASPAKQRSGGIKNISEEMEPAQERGMKKELRRIKKKKPSTIEAENVKVEDPKKGIVDTLPKNNENNKTKKDTKQLTAKQKALKALKDAQEDNEVSNIEKETSKVKKNSTKKRKQAKRKDSQAERRTEKTKRLEERIERRKSRRSPAKQTAKQKANLPPKVVDAIAAKQGKSPAKQRTGGHGITKKTPELGNKNAEIGADGKMTIISANMAKNQKPLELKKMKHKKMKMEKIELKKNNSSR